MQKSLEFPVIPWDFIDVESHPGQYQGAVSGPARLSSRPHWAPRVLQAALAKPACRVGGVGTIVERMDVLRALSCQQGKSFSLVSAVSSIVPGTWVGV